MGPRAEQPKRRTFTAEYKLAMVAEYDAATEPGAKGALLRREGLYSSHIIEWRRARDAGALAVLVRGWRTNLGGRRVVRPIGTLSGCGRRTSGCVRSWPGRRLPLMLWEKHTRSWG
jgi:hypothetical protein